MADCWFWLTQDEARAYTRLKHLANPFDLCQTFLSRTCDYPNALDSFSGLSAIAQMEELQFCGSMDAAVAKTNNNSVVALVDLKGKAVTLTLVDSKGKAVT